MAVGTVREMGKKKNLENSRVPECSSCELLVKSRWGKIIDD
jgi:hypothetical protein